MLILPVKPLQFANTVPNVILCRFTHGGADMRAQPALSSWHSAPSYLSRGKMNRTLLYVHRFSLPGPTPCPFIQGNVRGNAKVI